MKVNDLFEQGDVRFDSAVILDALGEFSGLEPNEIAIAQHIADRISQSHPDEVTGKDIKAIINEPATIEIEDENAVDAYEILNYIFRGAGIDMFDNGMH